MYLHTAAMMGVTPSPIGLPAYHIAGIVNVQNDTHHATAIPWGPHGSAIRNNSMVTVHSTIPQ